MNDFGDMNTLNPEPEKSQLPLVSMSLGISGVVSGFFCCELIAIPLGIAAIVLAVICLTKKIEYNKGFTWAGLGTGIAAVVIHTVILLIMVSVVGLAVFIEMMGQ